MSTLNKSKEFYQIKLKNDISIQYREEILSKTIMGEDLEATTIVSCVPAKKNLLTDALEKIRNQTTKQNKQ